MGDRDREDSPDWMRSFQPPSHSITTLSSSSDASADLNTTTATATATATTGDVTSQHHLTVSTFNSSTPKRRLTLTHDVPAKRRRKTKTHNSMLQPAPDHLLLSLSSDSESDSTTAVTDDNANSNAASKEKKKKNKKKIQESIKETNKGNHNKDSTSKVVTKRNSPNKSPEVQAVESTDNDQLKDPLKFEGEVGDVDAVEEGLPEKHVESRVTSSTLTLLLPEKVSRSKVLVECEGESIDLSGDMGAVGRVIIPENISGEPEMFLDLKGTIYRTTIVPSRTFCVVSIGQSEAKIEAIMNDFIQLKAQSNVYDAETMVEGTLEGFSFDSEDEAEKTAKDGKADENEGAEEETGKKPRGKVEKKLVGSQKKGKAAAGKQAKKRKPQATKKSKAKK